MPVRHIEPAYKREPLSQADYERVTRDFEFFCKKCIYIINKEGKPVAFILNEIQKDYATAFFEKFYEDPAVPINDVIHKPRQVGISTLIAAICVYICIGSNNFNIAYAMPDQSTAATFLEQKFKPVIESLHQDILPMVESYKDGEYIFKGYEDATLNNRVFGISARARAAGRSTTTHGVILDEYAYYEYALNFERGIVASVPKVGRVFRIVASTANGMNHFYELTKTAKQKNNNWRHFFYAWHMLKEYEMTAKKLRKLTEYQMYLLDEFEKAGYPTESWARKLAWYDYVLETEAKGDEQYMYENYPSNEEESFLSSGRPVFNLSNIMDLEEAAAKNPFVYVEPYTAEAGHNIGKVTFNVVPNSTIKMFAPPNELHTYVIGVDPSEGGEQGDFSAACVIDIQTRTTVASLREKIEQNDLAEVVVALAKYYNNAKIIPERNRGQAFITWCKRIGYHRIYADAKYSTLYNTNYGVYMTRQVKNDLITDMKFLINNKLIGDYDQDFLEEAKHFVYKHNRAVGESGWHDDVVMSRLLAIRGLPLKEIQASLSQ